MALAANAVMTFTAYTVEDAGLRMHFTCANPGPGEVTEYTIVLTDAEINAVTDLPSLRTLVQSKLNRAFRASTLTTKLDGLIGQSLTVP